MDAVTAAALAGKAVELNVVYVLIGLFVVVGAFIFLACLGEKALGLDLRAFIDNVELAADHGNLMPGVITFIIVPAAIMGLIIWIGLR